MSLSENIKNKVEVAALRTVLAMVKLWSDPKNRGVNYNSDTLVQSASDIFCMHMENNVLPHLHYSSRDEAIWFGKNVIIEACKNIK